MLCDCLYIFLQLGASFSLQTAPCVVFSANQQEKQKTSEETTTIARMELARHIFGFWACLSGTVMTLFMNVLHLCAAFFSLALFVSEYHLRS